jgi:CHRD domain
MGNTECDEPHDNQAVNGMRKLIAMTAVGVLALVVSAGALANHKPGHPEHPAKGKKANKNAKANKPAKVTICHRTLSTEKPTVTIRVSERAWKAHEKHGDAMGACQGGEPRGATRLEASMTAVSGATGSGTASVDVRLKKNSALVCYTLNVTGVDSTAAHIHTSTAQTLGGQSFAANAIVVPFKAPNDNGKARGCTKTTLAIGKALLPPNTANFYVNVHSASFLGGQVQGPLALA